MPLMKDNQPNNGNRIPDQKISGRAAHRLIPDFMGVLMSRRYRPAMLLIVAASILIGIGYYWTQWRNSPVQDGLKALRRSYRHSRPLEARVTGDFAYQPYEAKRGGPVSSEIDHDQFSYALAELTRAVASQPTTEARHALGRLYLLDDKFERAEEQLTLALGGAPREARLHADLATLYYERSKYANQLALLSKALEHYNSAIGIEPRLVEALFNRALCRERMGLFTDARADWERYLQYDTRSPWAGEAREHLKNLEERVIGTADSDKRVQAEFRTAARTGDEKAMRRLMTGHFIVVSRMATGELYDEYLRTSLGGETESASAYLKALIYTGQLADEIKGDRFIADAVNFASQGSPAVKQSLKEVRSMLRQADQSLARGSIDAAFNFYLTARRAAKQIGDQCHEEIAAFNLARYYNSRNDHEGLSVVIRQLLANTEDRRHRQLQAQALAALVNAYLGSMEISRALELSLRAAEIAKELNDVDTGINSLRYAGIAYARIGDYERAIEKNFEAISLLRNYPVTPLRAAQTYGYMGETLFRMGNYSGALDYHLESLRVAERSNNPMIVAGVVGRLGLNCWKLGRNEDAIRYLNDAITRAERIEDQTARQLLQLDAYATLGDFSLSQNRPDKAIAAYQLAIKISGEINNRTYLSAIHEGLAAAYLAQGKVAEAEAELQVSIRLAERDRRQINDARGRSVFLASRQNVYYSMMDFQLRTKRDPAQAFNYAEVSKSRDLLDALTGPNNPQQSDGRVTLTLLNSARPLTLKEVQRVLPANAQLVEYAVAQDRLMVWLVTRDKVISEGVDVGATRLRQMINDYLTDLRARRNTEILNHRASDLYRLLISPLASQLDRSRELLIVPDSVLFQLPFAALVSPETQRYLVEDFSLTVNPSASVLVQTMALSRSKKSGANEALFGLSNPRFNPKRFPNLPALPSSEEEVTRVKSKYARARFLNQEHATESALVGQIGNYEIVHLATHVIIDEQAPLLSSIVLADERDQPPRSLRQRDLIADGALQAYEIYRLKMTRTRLIVLSGCRSALGSSARGEALSGLAQAFFAAGVPSVIASLWDVDDESTSELMQTFHDFYRLRQRSFSEALRRAQCSMIQSADPKHRHPYHWAAFLLAGNSHR
jgi:CHAT domain-containing protein